MKKNILFLCLLCLLLSGCSRFDGQRNKESIFSYVETNQELLLSCICEEDYTPLRGRFSPEEINVEENHVDFDWRATGFGSETAYCGFFWSESGDLYAAWCAPPAEEPLTPRDDGFFWQEAEGDNTYYVEKICDNFFYYEGTF